MECAFLKLCTNTHIYITYTPVPIYVYVYLYVYFGGFCMMYTKSVRMGVVVLYFSPFRFIFLRIRFALFNPHLLQPLFGFLTLYFSVSTFYISNGWVIFVYIAIALCSGDLLFSLFFFIFIFFIFFYFCCLIFIETK